MDAVHAPPVPRRRGEGLDDKRAVDHGTFKRITLTLHMCDMINEERLDTRKYVYSLKTAA